MKAASWLILVKKRVNGQSARLAGVMVLGAMVTGCHNYTSAPLCNDSNQVNVPGITGTYSFSQQHPMTFEVQTQIMEVRYPQDGVLLRTEVAGSFEEESATCFVSGNFIKESQIDEVNGYRQEVIHVTGMGVSLNPLMYDKRSLDDAKIPNKVFEMPEQFTGLIGQEWAAKVEGLVASVVEGSGPLGILVENEGIAPEDLIDHTEISPLGVTLIRK